MYFMRRKFRRLGAGAPYERRLSHCFCLVNFGFGGKICSSSYHLPSRLIDHPNWLRGLDATFTELTINGEENRTKTEDLVLRSEGRGHKFESCRVHHFSY